MMMVVPSIVSMIVTSFYLNHRRIAIISHLQQETEGTSANSSMSSDYSTESSFTSNAVVTIMGIVDTEEDDETGNERSISPIFLASTSKENIFEFAEFPEIAFLGLFLLIALEFQGLLSLSIFCPFACKLFLFNT